MNILVTGHPDAHTLPDDFRFEDENVYALTADGPKKIERREDLWPAVLMRMPSRHISPFSTEVYTLSS